MNTLDTLIINNPDLSTLERAAYCAQTADAWRAYCGALEETLDDMGNQRAEAERLAEELATAEERINTMEADNAEQVAELEATISRLEDALQDAGASAAPAEACESAPAQAPAICSAGLPTVATHGAWGEIIELRTIDNRPVRVARTHFEDPSKSILPMFTRTGTRKPGWGIARGNLLTDGAELTPAAQLESALKAHGWRVARYPRSAEQRAKLAGMGFDAIIQTAPGQFEPHPLGLAWAKPGAVVASGEEKTAADNWTPDYSKWRHGGWYVRNVGYSNGCSGCVSRNYPDKKWRIVCDPRRTGKLGEPGDFTYKSRDDAAMAERLIATAAPMPDPAPTVPTSGEVPSAPACPTLLPGRWIPGGAENAERIAFDAALGAEVWLIASSARPGALAVIAYAGKRTKHDAHYTMRDRAQALTWAGEYMGKQQAAAQRQADQRAEKAAKRAAGHKLKAGDVLRCSWGYDQTNIDYYEVTRLVGARMVEIRKIGAESVNDGGLSMTGDCVPRPGHYIGEPMRKAVSDYDGQSVKIASYAIASKIEPREVAGVKLFPVDHWTAYA